MFAILLFVAGVAVLVVGGDRFVRGSAEIARLSGLSPLIIGLTIVAFGTSAPELGVSLQAALEGRPALSVGNVAGSNIFNVLVVLGLSALFAPLAVQSRLVRLDVPIMIGASLVFMLFVLDGAVGFFEGVLLFASAVAYTFWLIRAGLRESAASSGGDSEEAPRARGIRAYAVNGGWIVLGLVCLVQGSNWTVLGAADIARGLGVDERVVGLTIVAAGTSLPELVASVVATLRGERDLAIGNVVGSNIFNILVILGLTAALAPGAVPVAQTFVYFDIPAVLAVAR